MDIRCVEDAAGIDAVRTALGDGDTIALDCEAAGYHRYSDRLCLIQLTVGHRTFLIDPFAVDPTPILKRSLEDPDVPVLMHGADFDVRLLARDLDIHLAGLFDTQVAAALLGAEAVGLSALLAERLQVRLSKKYQKADWAQRPLPEPMRAYAAHDTLHLHALADELRTELEAADRMEWAIEEFRALEQVRFDDDGEADPVVRVKDARTLEPREVARLREALGWREGIARARDRAPFRVVGDRTLLEAARRGPNSVPELRDLPGMNGSLAEEAGSALLERFRTIDQVPDTELRGYPRYAPNGNGGRPPPEVEERLSRLKAARNATAAELGVDRGLLLPNAVLQLLAQSPPQGMEALVDVEGIHRWQAEAVGPRLLEVL